MTINEKLDDAIRCLTAILTAERPVPIPEIKAAIAKLRSCKTAGE